MDDGHSMMEEPAAGPETPEDVAILYSWANLPGAKYRDFSASRREFRAQQRARAAEAQRQTELAAARQMEEASQREIEEAHRKLEETEGDAQAEADQEAKQRAEEELRLAEERAQQERQEIDRREQAAEDLRQRAERARQEMLDARKRAEEQAARYAEADAQYHAEIDGRFEVEVPGQISDPYYYAGHADPAYFAATRGVRTAQATGRKPYPYPAPGSEEYDSGVLTGYSRNGSQFAPAQGRRTPSSPLREAAVETVSHVRDVSPSEPQQQNEDTYFSRRPAAEVRGTGFPNAGEYVAPGVGPGSARLQEIPSEVHIRPATVSSRDDRQPYQPPRHTVMADAALPATRMAGTARNDVRREASPMHEITPVPGLPQADYAMHAAGTSGGKTRPRVLPNSREASQLRFDGGEVAEDLRMERDTSRMFLPKEHPRISPTRSWDDASQSADAPGAAPRVRKGRGDGELRSALPGTERSAGDASVQHETEHDPMRLHQAQDMPELEEGSEEEVGPGWGVVNRTMDANSRRRREAGPSPMTRTARQPRGMDLLPKEMAATDADGPAPPAWLSAERTAQPVSASSLPFYEADLDPTLPLPRAVPRRTPLGVPQHATAAAWQDGAVSAANDAWQPTSGREADISANAGDTLQGSRERVASRWFALSGLMGTETRDKPEQRPAPRVAPNLCVLSISGGVGKTSIVATLGRALSSLGEKVLLVDTNVHGILPYYFGAREPRPGTVRTFAPPSGSVDAPVVLVSYDADGRGYDEAVQTRVLEDLARRSQNTQRVLLDVGISSAWLARRLAQDNPWILVPVAPDMNSVLGTRAVERLFHDVVDHQGQQVKPYYVLNQYDASLPLHLDVREVLRQLLGDRLLPMTLHRTPAVSEALAEGMTVIDYAAGTPIAQDYMNLAAWVRRLSDPGADFPRGPRWSER